MSKVIHLGNENEYNKIIESNEIVLVDFFATWCRPCQMLGPVLDELSEEVSTPIVKVDVNEFPELAGKFGVATIPTLLVYRKGEIANTHIGFASKVELKNLISE